ncbi:MAG TPA: AAA family ATPase [Candidatus Dormibacteraeota bacterium]|nr:AAA family ATPase [Candidatus Dormibacteraeota bacterium]
MVSELPSTSLRWTCDPNTVGAKSTEELKPLEVLVGQPRAHQALLLGLTAKESGFNIFAAGPIGTGKTTAITDFLEDIAKGLPTPSDWCYVHNFEDEYQPKALRCPPGIGKQLKQDLREFIQAARIAIPQVFSGEDYASKREEMSRRINVKRQDIITRMSETAEQAGFLLQLTALGLSLVPVVKGRPMKPDDFAALPKETQQRLLQQREAVTEKLEPLMRELRELEAAARDEVTKFDRDVTLYAIEHLMSNLLEKYKAYDEITHFLQIIQEHVAADLDRFRGRGEEKPDPREEYLQEIGFRVYEVNVIVDNSDVRGGPIVVEQNPTYDNVLGRIERESQFGTLTTDFTLVRGGSVHRANGGFLIMRAEELLRDYVVYDSLKRGLKAGEIRIEDLPQRIGYANVRSLAPEPIPLDVKIVLIGDTRIYQLLYAYDPEFRELFRVKAEFDSTMDRTEDNVRKYAGFFATLATNENLKHLDASAMARLMEHSCRLAEDRDKLSTQFGLVADTIREAHFYAQQDDSKYITSKHVERAIEAKIYRSNLIQEKISEYIQKGVIFISTEGEVTGQINGLSVLSLGDFSFGAPSRITVGVGLGKEGLIDVQREVAMSGPIHGKGVMIIAGYLASKFARDKPLTLTARIVFEQNYEGVEGDSASSTELYALLSALSGVPIKQHLAVTGSVNQKGEVQPIGGANEKIEGYFEVCKARGLDGLHGVVIPQSNVRNLMLKQEVLDAVKDGKFHVYPVSTIEEGVEVLTGKPAGEQLPDGGYEENTIYGLVDKRLREMAETVRRFQAYAA